MALSSQDRGAGIKFPPPLLYAAFLGLGILVSAKYPVRFLRSTRSRALGGVLLAAGIGLGPLWGMRTLLGAGTTSRPDKPVSTLVTDGPYRYSRNPLYLALSLMYAGIALLAGSVWALLMLLPVNLIMSRFVIRREEAYLAEAFGEEYQQYMLKVRRWL